MTAHGTTQMNTEWCETYRDLVMTAPAAAALVKPGQRVFIGTGCGEPQELVEALVARSCSLADVEIVHLLTFGAAPYAKREFAHCFRTNSFFVAENVRGAIHEGLGDYTPIFLSEIPRLFKSGELPLDVALIQVSPPDYRGRCSLGISVDIVKSAAQNASLVIAQVNEQMPRTLGDSFITVQDIDVLVPVNVPLLELPPPEPTSVDDEIAEHIASLVDDGCTLELGIGKIPQSVLRFLRDKHDLGIHTEMFSDAIIDLIESGVITGSKKSIDRGKIVASFCLGTKRLYDYVDDNPVFSFRPTEYVNDPFVIGRHDKMVAINIGLEIDLTGQVCADSLGTRFYSGIGGQVDFNRGAARSQGGKAIIALPSTAMDDSVSRIVAHLSPGAGVVTSRGDVNYVVTEYGVAYLRGKSVHDRAIALISIAHPKYRDELLQKAIEAKYVRTELADVKGRILVGPDSLRTSLLLDDGTVVRFRAIHPTDQPLMQDLFYALSQQTVYYRFMGQLKSLPHKQIRDFVYVDHREQVTVVGTLPTPQGEEIVATGMYCLDKKTNRAEVAFVVRDEWQNRGLGTFMLKHLASVARRNGIAGFTAEVLAGNRKMQSVLHNVPANVTSTMSDGVHSFELEFEAP